MEEVNAKQLLENIYQDINDLYLNQDKISNKTINKSLSALSSYLDKHLDEL